MTLSEADVFGITPTRLHQGHFRLSRFPKATSDRGSDLPSQFPSIAEYSQRNTLVAIRGSSRPFPPFHKHNRNHERQAQDSAQTP
jgi:hypothetical protein